MKYFTCAINDNIADLFIKADNISIEEAQKLAFRMNDEGDIGLLDEPLYEVERVLDNDWDVSIVQRPVSIYGAQFAHFKKH